MHNSRKTFLNVLLDNLINLLDLSIIALFVYFIITKSLLYIIPLAVAILLLVLNLFISIKKQVTHISKKGMVNVIVDNKEMEKPRSKLKRGEDVVLYPSDEVNFVGYVKQGIIFVDESRINGITSPCKKSEGDYVKKGSIVLQGRAVIEIKEFKTKQHSGVKTKQPLLKTVINVINLVLPLVSIALIVTNYLLDKSSLDNILKCSLLSIPLLFNLVMIVFSLVSLKRFDKTGTKVIDPFVLGELNKVDVVCFDKSGTITTGEYEVFKKVPIMSSAFSSVSTDTSRAFDLLVSSIIETTNEKGGMYDALREHFIFESTKIISAFSSLGQNGFYSAITINNGKSYAIGEPEAFDLANIESSFNFINEYN